MDIINLTPSKVVVVRTSDIKKVKKGEDVPALLDLEPGDPFLRFTEFEKYNHIVAGVPLKTVLLGHPILGRLPPPQPGVLYVVSRIIADRMPEREDFVFRGGVIRPKGEERGQKRKEQPKEGEEGEKKVRKCTHLVQRVVLKPGEPMQ